MVKSLRRRKKAVFASLRVIQPRPPLLAAPHLGHTLVDSVMNPQIRRICYCYQCNLETVRALGDELMIDKLPSFHCRTVGLVSQLWEVQSLA